MNNGRHFGEWWRGRRRGLAIGVVVALAIAAGTGAVRLVRAAPSVPTAEVRQGEFVDTVQVRGEVKAVRSMVLVAPSGAGDIQIVKLVKSGEMVKPNDVVVQFDVTDLKDKLDTRRSELKQAEAEIEGARAKGRMTEEQDQTDLAKAKFDVQRARLDAGKQEILSQIDAEKAKLALSDAEQMLRETQKRLESDRQATAAEIAGLQAKRGKAQFDVKQAQTNIEHMTLKAPLAGMMTVLPNFRAIQGYFVGSPPSFREGDRAWPGAGIAELPDLNSIVIFARVDETDRGRLAAGQTVKVRVDAVPDTEFAGQVSEISPLTKIDWSGWPPQKNFDVKIQLDKVDARLRPGMSATARVATERIADATLVPAEASFQKSGKTLVYVLRGSRFQERAIEVTKRSNGQLAVKSGVAPGERVALKDPTIEEKGR